MWERRKIKKFKSNDTLFLLRYMNFTVVFWDDNFWKTCIFVAILDCRIVKAKYQITLGPSGETLKIEKTS